MERELLGEHDRAKIILSSTLLEDALVYRLLVNLKFKPDEDEADYIFRFEGPLGSFSSRIEIAYIFGVIDKTTAEQLHLIREMRNACAHSKFILDFSMSELVNVAKRLFKPLGQVNLENDTGDEIRNAYLAEFAIIYTTLTVGSRTQALAAMRERLQYEAGSPPPSPDTERQQP